MQKALKLIHISDLHCNAKKVKEWKEAFSQVSELLVRELDEDTLVVLTGDLVDSPTTKNFDSLFSALKDVLGQVKGPKPLGYVCVPGNHDLFVKGNRVLSKPKRILSRLKSFCTRKTHESPYSKFEAKLAELCSGIPDDTYVGRALPFIDVRRRLMREYGVALFLLDSNGAEERSFAEGYVSPEQIVENESVLEGLAGGPIFSCRKVALLHHHPIAIHNGKPSLKRGIEEAAMDLTNKYTLLNSLAGHGVDIVLHGHRHKSTKYSIDPSSLSADRTLAVSGCGTSCALGESRGYEVKIYKFSSIDVRGQSLTAAPREEFSDTGRSYVLVGPEKTRRKIRREGYKGACNYTQNHLSGTSKTKEVLLFPEGRVTVEIAFNGLETSNSKNGNPISLKELIAADRGRIFAASAVFDLRGVAYQDSPENWNSVPLVRPRNDGPCDNEHVELTVTNDHGAVADTLRIQYRQLGGFATDDYSLRELYSRPSAEPRTEYCTVYSQIPVASLELCVTFPEGLFPLPKSFTVKAYERNQSANTSAVDQEIQGQQYHGDETEFLRNHNSLRVWQLSRTVSLYVPDPQPNLLYAIHWEVPKATSMKTNTSADEISKTLLRPRPANMETKRRDLFQDIEKSMRRAYGDDLQVFAFVPALRGGQRVLDLVYPAIAVEDGSPLALLPGRGIAGAAYLGRLPVYYNQGFRSADNQYVEKLVPGLDPKAVVGLPVTHPAYWNGKGSEERVVFVLTVVTEDTNSSIYVDGMGLRQRQAEACPDHDRITKMFQRMGTIVAETLPAHAEITRCAERDKRRNRRVSNA